MAAHIPVIHHVTNDTHEPLASGDTLSLNAAQIAALQSALGLPDDNQTAAQVSVSPTVAGASDVQTALTNVYAAIPVITYATAAEIQTGHPDKVVTADDLATGLILGIDHRIKSDVSISDNLLMGNTAGNANVISANKTAGAGQTYVGVNSSSGAGNVAIFTRSGSGLGDGINATRSGTGTGYAGSFNDFVGGGQGAVYAYSNSADGAVVLVNGAGATSAGVFTHNGNSLITRLSTMSGGNFGVSTNGNILAAGTLYPSDARLKSKREPIVGALDTVMAMERPSWYFWDEGTAQYQQDQKRQIGYMAQDVEKHVPEAAGEVNYPLPPVPVDPMSRVPATPVEPAAPEGYKEFLEAVKAAEKEGAPVAEVPGYQEAAAYHAALDQFKAATAQRDELVAMSEKDTQRYKEQVAWYESQVELSKKLGGKIKVNDLTRMVPMLHAALQDLTIEFREFKASINK